MENPTGNPTEDTSGTPMTIQTEGEQPQVEEDMGGNIEQAGQAGQEEQEEEQGEGEVEQQQQQEEEVAYVDDEEEVFEICRIPSIESVSHGPDTTDCTICYRTFPTASLTTLPCGHAFSHKCILNWTQIYDEKAFADCNVRCPMCRTYLLYHCGDVISENHLRPGVKILPQELTLNCQSYVNDTDTHSVETTERPWNPRSIAERRRRIQQQQNDDDDDDDDDDEEDIFEMDDINGQEGPEGPPNTEENPNNTGPLDHALAAITLQGGMPARPSHTTFRFGPHVAAEPGYVPPSVTMEEFFISKITMANALDTNKLHLIYETIDGLREDLRDFKKTYPQFPVANNELAWRNLEMFAKRVIEMHKQYKRQHEGFIELTEVALNFRKEREVAMLEQLDLFWRCLCWIDRELNRAWRNVDDAARIIWLKYKE
ncbi:hypothetical protein F4806DRAFT_507705 [Annulohypoxylon nitens]|nr:hypothetical protein F4806DRAFT_507705 [Annulohypoxylon nitens]